MTERTKTPAPTRIGGVSELASRPAAIASANAPLIFGDVISCYGKSNGVTFVTIEAFQHALEGDQPTVTSVATAHLRLTAPAARQLREALATIELAATKPDGPLAH